MQLSQTPTQTQQASFPGRDPHVLFLIIKGYTFKYYYVVHPHTQYRGTMLQQGFWC